MSISGKAAPATAARRALPDTDIAAIARILDSVDTALERARAAVERAREVRASLAGRVAPVPIEPIAEYVCRSTAIHRPSFVTDSRGCIPEQTFVSRLFRNPSRQSI